MRRETSKHLKSKPSLMELFNAQKLNFSTDKSLFYVNLFVANQDTQSRQTRTVQNG